MRASSTQPEGSNTLTRPRATALFLVRHAQSTWNAERRIQGQLDPPLSTLGLEQARLVGRRLGSLRWEAIYSSDLRRARQTADSIAGGAVLTPGLREVALGHWEGLSREEIIARDPELWALWVREPDWDIVPGGEGSEPFRMRVEAALSEILGRHPGEQVLVVTHGGVIQAGIAWALGIPIRGLFKFVIGNASVSVIEQSPGGRLVIAGVNDTGHLSALDEPPA